MMRGLAADKNNKGYWKYKIMILKIFLCNNLDYLNFNVGLSDDSRK